MNFSTLEMETLSDLQKALYQTDELDYSDPNVFMLKLKENGYTTKRYCYHKKILRL